MCLITKRCSLRRMRVECSSLSLLKFALGRVLKMTTAHVRTPPHELWTRRRNSICLHANASVLQVSEWLMVYKRTSTTFRSSVQHLQLAAVAERSVLNPDHVGSLSLGVYQFQAKEVRHRTVLTPGLMPMRCMWNTGL